jgi:signal transduction histidine kinase/phage shock protein PspC (stress-responsive transcriptional regulator)
MPGGSPMPPAAAAPSGTAATQAPPDPVAELFRPKPRPPLVRPREGRKIAGVAAGLATHLGLKLKAVRIGFVVTGLLGAGLVLYVWFCLTVPSGDTSAKPPALARLAPKLRQADRQLPALRLLVGVLLVALAGLVVAAWFGADIPWQWLLPGLALLGGLALAWSQLETADAAAPRSRGISWLRLIGALALVVLGIALLIAQDRGPSSVLWALLAGLAVLAGVALVLAPWWLRLIGALGDERAARARESERADIAAHLHDSVLQTLAVLRARADDPEAVRRLARAQERELREWLYQDRAQPGTSLAARLREVAGEVEDITGVEVGVVLVGDSLPTAPLEALVSATREALLNACRHGAPPVSLYAEVAGGTVSVFVRDRGAGFSLAEVAADRLGVRESILGRVRRHGGTAELVSSPERGTEVRLTMPAGDAVPAGPGEPVGAGSGEPAGDAVRAEGEVSDGVGK